MSEIQPGGDPDELRVFDHGFVRLDACMADDLSVVNSARVSFAVRKQEMDDRDKGLIGFLMRERHGTPFEHNSFRFHIRCPIFVAREWFRHRVGCLAGETEVTLGGTRPGSPVPLARPIEQLWAMWNGAGAPARDSEDGVSSGTTRGLASSLAAPGQAARRRAGNPGDKRTTVFPDPEPVREIRLRTLNERTNSFVPGDVSSIVHTGIQPVYRLTMANGRSLSLTASHRVLSEGGWQTLRQAVGLKGSGPGAKMTSPARLLAERHDPHPKPWMTKAHISRPGEYGSTAHLLAVSSVEYSGMQPTYDLSVRGPWHNFVANGIVVHNSFNEESARYHKLSDDFYLPEPEAVRTQVGKPGAYRFDPVDPALAQETIDTLRDGYRKAYEKYVSLVEKGVAKELARAVLPFGIYTQFYWTLNARSLMNFIALRNADSAQYEIRVYARAVEQFFRQKMPVTYEWFMESGRKAP